MKKFSVLFSIILFVGFFSGCRQTEYSDTQFYFDTVCTIRAGGKDAAAAAAAAFDRISAISKAMDYHSPDSAVSAVNRAEAGIPVCIDSDTFSVIKTAETVSAASDGAFSITVAPVKDLWGFGKEPHSVPRESDIKAALQYVNDGFLTLDEEHRTVTKSKSDVKIDLGGIAKGYAADCALEVLKDYSVSYAIIDLGGNVSVFGENPNSKDGQWTVGIQKPFGSPGECADTLTIPEGSVVTSGIYQRNFTENGVLYHHILDPKTGYPSNNKKNSATVVSESSVLADCLATACMVLPEYDAKKLTEQFDVQLYFN